MVLELAGVYAAKSSILKAGVYVPPVPGNNN